MAGKWSQTAVHGGYSYLIPGDNRDSFFTRDPNGNSQFVWAQNMNSGYNTWKIKLGYVNKYWDSYGEEYDLVTSGRNYKPAMAYDAQKKMWLFWELSEASGVKLVYQKRQQNYYDYEAIYSPIVLEPSGATNPALMNTTYKGLVLAYEKGTEIVVRTIVNGQIGPKATVAYGKSPILSQDASGTVWMAWIATNGATVFAPLNLN